ncbi:MAG: HAMP domain-containing histidine kinase [Candidatus Binatia bacterium]|nr:HAMP domain-containing histidine kinase [Candidatus Binatia bacterium]
MPESSGKRPGGPKRASRKPPENLRAWLSLADLVWPWRWQPPGAWRAGTPNSRDFLGRRVEPGSEYETVAGWMIPEERDTLLQALERAREGTAVRVNVRMRHQGGSEHEVCVLALPSQPGARDEVTLVFLVAGPSPAPSTRSLVHDVARGSTHQGYVQQVTGLLSSLRDTVGCETVELVLHGALGGECAVYASAEQGAEGSPRVEEPRGAFEQQEQELSLGLGTQPPASVRLRGLPASAHGARWRSPAVEELLRRLEAVVTEWALTAQQALWQRLLGLLHAAQAARSDPERPSLQELCSAVAAACGAERAHVWIVDERMKVCRLAAQWGFAAEESAALQVLEVPAHLLPLEDNLPVQAVREPIAPPRDFDAPGVAAQLCLRLDERGVLLLDWCAEAPAPHTALLEVVRLVASLWFAATQFAFEAQQAARLKSDFVATMSHELRTPLNTLMGYTDLLACGEFGPLTPEQTEVLERMGYSARELLDLINATLDFGRFESQQVALEIESVSLAALLDEIDRELAHHRRRRSLSFAVTVEAGAAQVQTDREKLKLVLKNLVANAIKFTERGGVEVHARREGAEIEITVKDTGVGIDPTVLPVIFEPFRQGEPAATRRFGGVGLGLYVVRRLLDLLGGSITVESQPGQGSTFRVRLAADPRSPA